MTFPIRFSGGLVMVVVGEYARMPWTMTSTPIRFQIRFQTTLELAKKNNHDNYGDIINCQHQIHFVDCADPAELEAEFQRIGLVPRLEIKDQFAFWKPDDAEYWTKSSPTSAE